MESENQTKNSDKNNLVFGMFGSLSTKSCSCSNNTEELMTSKIYEKLGCLSVEVENVKSDNKVLTEKNNTLVANNREMQARLEAMEQKLKVAELEKKLAEQGMHNLVAMKVNEANGQLREELFKLNNEQVAKMLDAKLKEMTGQLEEKQSKFIFDGQDAKMLEKDKKLEQLEEMAKQLGQGITDLGGKVTDLQSQVSDCQNRCEAFALKLASLESSENETQREMLELSKDLFKVGWSKNRLHGEDGVRVSADGLVVTANMPENVQIPFLASFMVLAVRAEKFVSRTMLASFSGLPLVYFEINSKTSASPQFGGSQFQVEWVYPGPNGIDWNDDNYYQSGRKIGSSATDKTRLGDVVGSGMLLSRHGQLKFFFTKNGRLNGTPTGLPTSDQQQKGGQELLFCPVITFQFNMDISAEANFGADLAKKPFKFDLEAHQALLFN